MYKPFHDEHQHCITNRMALSMVLCNIMPFYCTAWEIFFGGIDYINILTLYTTTTQTLWKRASSHGQTHMNVHKYTHLSKITVQNSRTVVADTPFVLVQHNDVCVSMLLLLLLRLLLPQLEPTERHRFGHNVPSNVYVSVSVYGNCGWCFIGLYARTLCFVISLSLAHSLALSLCLRHCAVCVFFRLADSFVSCQLLNVMILFSLSLVNIVFCFILSLFCCVFLFLTHLLSILVINIHAANNHNSL